MSINKSLAFYTCKWFLLWSFRFVLLGFVLIGAVWALMVLVMKGHTDNS
jgi:hypothetical protein